MVSRAGEGSVEEVSKHLIMAVSSLKAKEREFVPKKMVESVTAIMVVTVVVLVLQ